MPSCIKDESLTVQYYLTGIIITPKNRTDSRLANMDIDRRRHAIKILSIMQCETTNNYYDAYFSKRIVDNKVYIYMLRVPQYS